MNQIQRSATIRRNRAIVSLLLLALLGTAALTIASARVATAAPAAQTCFGGGPCPTPPPTPTPGPVCPARSPSSKPIGNILDLGSTGGVKVERRFNGTTFVASYVVFFVLQSDHAFVSSIPPCTFDDEVATRFDQSPNIQSATSISRSAHEIDMEIVPIDANAATAYRFRLKYQQNLTQNPGGNPKFRTCTLALPSGMAPGQQLWIAPTACSTDG